VLQIGATPTEPYGGLAANPDEIPIARLARLTVDHTWTVAIAISNFKSTTLG